MVWLRTGGWRGWRAWLLVLAGGGWAWGAELTDQFADRQVIVGDVIELSGSNVGATVEPGEPRHAGKRGGHSLWVSWVASASGLVTLRTEGSAIDTLLAAYTLEPGTDPVFDRLWKVGEDDDDGASMGSALEFGVQAGARYEFAVDGYAGATGAVRLWLTFQAAAQMLPTILRQSNDSALRDSAPLILTVDIQSPGAFELKWFFNDRRINEAESRELIIPRFGPANVGWYRVEVEAEGLKFSSPSIEIQLNSEGEPLVLARDKTLDATQSGLPGWFFGGGRSRVGLSTMGGGISRGYNGTQIFNTIYATADPAEPKPCGLDGGASYWFAYQAPVDGVLVLDTAGSNFDTVLAVYSYQEPLLGYESLVPVACDRNSGPGGASSRLEVPVTVGANYLIDLDGVKGARGIAYLNYRLTPRDPVPTQPPVITRQPASLDVALGTTVALEAATVGATPLFFQWQKDGVALTGETNASLVLTAASAGAAGRYQLQVSNVVAQVTSVPAVVRVWERPLIRLDAAAAAAVVAFPAQRGYQYAIDYTAALGLGPWGVAATALTDAHGMVWLTNSVPGIPARYYRLRAL